MRNILCASVIAILVRGADFISEGQCRCPCPTTFPTPAPIPPTEYRCVSAGDPHLRSFYNNYFDNMVSGEVVLWRNDNIEIQTRQQTMRNSASINSGIALRGAWTCGYTLEFTRGEINGNSWQDTSTMRVTDSNGNITADRVSIALMSNVIHDLDCSTLSMEGSAMKQDLSIHFVPNAKVMFRDLEKFTNISIWTNSEASDLDGDIGLCVELATTLSCDSTFFTTYWDGADCNSVTPSRHVNIQSSESILDTCDHELREAADEYCKFCKNFDEDENQLYYNCVVDICIGGDVSFGIGVKSICNSSFIGELPNSGCFKSSNCNSGHACLEDGVCECAFTGNKCAGCCGGAEE